MLLSDSLNFQRQILEPLSHLLLACKCHVLEPTLGLQSNGYLLIKVHEHPGLSL